MRFRRHLPLLSFLVVLGLGAVLACSKASPVAPSGTVLAISASPARIATPTGTSVITAIASKGNGQPVNKGTEIRFDATLGTIDAVVTTDDSGIAHATLKGDGRVGMSTVHASSGSLAPVMLMVQIGSSAASLTLQATPSAVNETGSGADGISLVALVRDDQGTPLAGANVNFSSQIGSLKSKGAFVQSGSNGIASDLLTVSAADISTLSGNTFNVTAQAAGSAGTLMTQTFALNVARVPVTSFTFVVDTATRTVVFTDASSPKATGWAWDFGDGQTSTEQNPTHTYGAGKGNTFFVTLTPKNAVGTGSSLTKQVTIGTTP